MSIPRFDRDFFSSGGPFSRIGDGSFGGKAAGLIRVQEALARSFDHGRFDSFEVRIPRTVVITTELFDDFLERNSLRDIALSAEPDARIAQEFQRAALPTEAVGDLRSLIEQVRVPLAVRSSSLLEDALYRPFAGVYETKMTPNNQPDPGERFRKFVEAIKLVYASTFFHAAKTYARVAGHSIADEKMAIVVQEVVGSRRFNRFYPTLSAVGKSYDFYSAEGVRPETGAMSLALGLGRTIVDGSPCWTYSPVRPKAPAPYGSNRDLMRASQKRFWAVNMGRPPAFDATAPEEYLIEGDLSDAELDGTLERVASTYDSGSDRLSIGTTRTGPRVLDFAPLLRLHGETFNDLARTLLETGRDAFERDVEIELAVDWNRDRERALFSFLQARPMVVAEEMVPIRDEELEAGPRLLLTGRAIGNGVREDIADIVYVRPEVFSPKKTPEIAVEVSRINAALMKSGRPYLLIGFGRWGTTDPWGGIPVKWEQIGGADAIVEASLPELRADPSQGSHFFHNVTSLEVLYFSLNEREQAQIDWDWLGSQETIAESEHVRHVRSREPILIKVDGTARRGGVWKA